MNKIKMAVLAVALCGGLFVTGCVTQNKQVLEKSTVFGFQAKTPGTASGTSVIIQIGLVRSEYFSNPVSTNAIYAGQFSSHVIAKLSAVSQSANEDISTLQQAVTVNTNEASVITTK